jgi:hypothetical protein
MGIRLDVDLRAQGSSPSGKGTSPALNSTSVYRTYDEQYDNWGDRDMSKGLSNPDLMKKTLGYIFQYVSEGKGVYIHCKIGSDRTGYVCLLLEAILGVPQHLCDVDYELTSFCGCLDNGETRTRDYAGTSQRYWFYYTRYGIPFLTGTSLVGNTLQEKAVYYVTHDLGFSDAEVAAFQNAMLEPVNQQ